MERERIDLEHELDNLETDATNSNAMLSKLKEEKYRWGEMSEKLGDAKLYIDGNSILTASMIVYAGSCFEQQRLELLKIFQNQLTQLNIKFNKNYSLVSMVSMNSNENEKFEWHEKGLPSDEFSQENAIITLSSKRTC